MDAAGEVINWTLLVIDHLNPFFFELRLGKEAKKYPSSNNTDNSVFFMAGLQRRPAFRIRVAEA
jgi:hypothetical protein